MHTYGLKFNYWHFLGSALSSFRFDDIFRMKYFTFLYIVANYRYIYSGNISIFENCGQRIVTASALNKFTTLVGHSNF